MVPIRITRGDEGPPQKSSRMIFVTTEDANER